MIARQVNQLEVLSCEPKERRHAAPLLFVHGAFAGAWVWDEHFLPCFAAKGYSAHAVSLRGHGGSAGHERIDWYSIHDYVEDVAEVVADLAAAPVLIGHSMGGFVVQKYLERHAVPAAVLMCSVPPQGLVAAQFSLLFEKPGLMMEINRLLGGGDVALDVLRSRGSDAQTPKVSSAIDRLRWLLAGLPPQQAEAIVCCDVMGLALRDVAVTSRVGVDQVRRRLAAGHERLARQMALGVAS